MNPENFEWGTRTQRAFGRALADRASDIWSNRIGSFANLLRLQSSAAIKKTKPQRDAERVEPRLRLLSINRISKYSLSNRFRLAFNCASSGLLRFPINASSRQAPWSTWPHTTTSHECRTLPHSVYSSAPSGQRVPRSSFFIVIARFRTAWRAMIFPYRGSLTIISRT